MSVGLIRQATGTRFVTCGIYCQLLLESADPSGHQPCLKFEQDTDVPPAVYVVDAQGGNSPRPQNDALYAVRRIRVINMLIFK